MRQCGFGFRGWEGLGAKFEFPSKIVLLAMWLWTMIHFSRVA